MKIYQVSEFIEHVNSLVGAEMQVVEGEVSGFSVSQGKWIFFDLKDERGEAKIGCFMTVFRLKTDIADGMKLRVLGTPKVYEKSGQFRVNVEAVELVGEGALRKSYELLLKRLDKEGLFAEERKRSIPRFPETVGVIASRESAAYGDFMRILGNRWGGLRVELAHVQVQGEKAVRDIVGAFNYFNLAKEKPDVLVLTRGGGSLEDLQAFNSEEIARAVFSSKIPVVVGVGHERDETIADFVADRRASTPSNAAELVVPDRREIIYAIASMSAGLSKSLQERVEAKKNMLASFAGILQAYVRQNSARLESLVAVLKSLDPKAVLKRGYAIARSGGKILKDAGSVATGDIISVQLSTGTVSGKIISKTL